MLFFASSSSYYYYVSSKIIYTFEIMRCHIAFKQTGKQVSKKSEKSRTGNEWRFLFFFIFPFSVMKIAHGKTSNFFRFYRVGDGVLEISHIFPPIENTNGTEHDKKYFFPLQFTKCEGLTLIRIQWNEYLSAFLVCWYCMYVVFHQKIFFCNKTLCTFSFFWIFGIFHSIGKHFLWWKILKYLFFGRAKLLMKIQG